MVSKRISITAGFFLVFLIVLHYIGWLAPLENLIQEVTTPFIAGTHSLNVRVGTSYELFKNRGSLEDAYATCVADTENDAVQLAKLKLLEQENVDLKAQLKFASSTTSTIVLATVVGKEILSPDQTIIINQGSNSGIKINDPVVGGSGILVGKIVKIEPRQSMVRLVNDSLSKVGAMVLNKNQSLGVVEGGYNISLIMSFIPRDEVVQKGDQVVTSGLEPGMPKGLLIGTITVVENEPYKPFQDAYISPATNLSKLSTVTVLITQ